MNALTFGLLITALERICPSGQSLTLFGAELLVRVVVVFRAPPASFARPFVTHRRLRIPLFSLDRHVNLPAPSANVSHGLATFYLQNRAGP